MTRTETMQTVIDGFNNSGEGITARIEKLLEEIALTLAMQYDATNGE